MKYFTLFFVLLASVYFIFGYSQPENTKEIEYDSNRIESSEEYEGAEKDNRAFVKLSPEEISDLWKYYDAQPKNSLLDNPAEPWISLGPKGIWDRTNTASAKVSGKILDAEMTSSLFFRVGAANGGLWEQPIIGEPFCLSENINSQKIGAFASNPLNPDIIIVGTGEIWTDRSRAGTGIFKTTNRGTNWTNVYPTSNFNSLFAVSKIIIDQQNPQNIYITGQGTNSNFLRTTNGGDNWSPGLIGFSTTATDLVLNTQSTNILIASIWNGNGGFIYKSTDYGASWNPIFAGLPLSNTGNVTITACKNQPNNLYALVANAASNLEGIYKSTNTGDNWTKLTSTPSAYDILSGQGFHANAISVSPVNPNLVLAGGVFLIRSTDGGATWDSVFSPGRFNPHVHADMQRFVWRNDGTQVFMCNDGGLSVSSNAGLNWSTEINKFPISEVTFFDVSDNNLNSLVTGLEHNGICVTQNGGVTWNMYLGGDGSGAAIHPSDFNKVYCTYGVFANDPNGLPFQIASSTNAGLNWAFAMSGIAPGCGQWYNQIKANRDPFNFQLFTNICKKVYTSTNFGANWTDLNMPSTPTSFIDYSIDAIPFSSSVVVATNDSTTSATNKAFLGIGGLWFDISPNIGNKILQKIKAANLLVAIVRGATDSSNKVLKMDISSFINPVWTKIPGNGLGKFPLADVMINYDDTSKIVVGTQGFGCFATSNGGQNWYAWNEGLPKGLAIAEMKYVVENNENYVYMGTYGRGIFKRKLSADVVNVSNNNGQVKGYQLMQNYPNPFNPVTTIKFMLPKSAFASIKIYDLTGKEVASVLNAKLPAGSHSVPFNASALSSGVYFYRMTSEDFSEVKKMMLVK